MKDSKSSEESKVDCYNKLYVSLSSYILILCRSKYSLNLFEIRVEFSISYPLAILSRTLARS
jgi:hypothetical protein